MRGRFDSMHLRGALRGCLLRLYPELERRDSSDKLEMGFQV